MTNSLPAKAAPHAPAEDVVQLAANELAAEITDHIEQMYPKAVEACGPSFLRSVRGFTYNRVLAMSKCHTEEELLAFIKRTREARKRSRKMWAKYRRRGSPCHHDATSGGSDA